MTTRESRTGLCTAIKTENHTYMWTYQVEEIPRLIKLMCAQTETFPELNLYHIANAAEPLRKLYIAYQEANNQKDGR